MYNASLEEHERHLGLVLYVFVDHKLFVNRKKCAFSQQQVEYLGHMTSCDGVSTDNQNTETVQQWPASKTFKKLRGFLGLTCYYR